jgi:hypothetical protein
MRGETNTLTANLYGSESKAAVFPWRVSGAYTGILSLLKCGMTILTLFDAGQVPCQFTAVEPSVHNHKCYFMSCEGIMTIFSII